jgi:hypothetical protein
MSRITTEKVALISVEFEVRAARKVAGARVTRRSVGTLDRSERVLK